MGLIRPAQIARRTWRCVASVVGVCLLGALPCARTTPMEIRRLESPGEFGHFRPLEDGFDDGEALRRGVVRDQHGLTGRIEGGARRFHPPPRSSHDSLGRQARDRRPCHSIF